MKRLLTSLLIMGILSAVIGVVAFAQSNSFDEPVRGKVVWQAQVGLPE
mgnify:CR=1 FL=1